MKEIFYELIKESCEGVVIIDNDLWPIVFNTIIEDEEKYIDYTNAPTLEIKNKERFFKLLEEYIDKELKANRKTIKFYDDIDKNHKKWLMAFLFANASLEDFKNPEQLLTKRIAFLEDKTFDYLNNKVEIPLDKNFLNSYLIIEKEEAHTSMETPYKINISLQDKEKTSIYHLPSIYYGIMDNTCYIYSVQNPKNENNQEDSYSKKINRLLYKLNKGIQEYESKEYKEYKENKSDYYPEYNISDVTPSFVLSLSIFIDLLEKENINTIKYVTYLPLRYLSRDIVSDLSKKKEQKEEKAKRNDYIQSNITNKMIRTFNRLSFHNPSIKIETLPFEVDEFLTISIGKEKTDYNNILLEEAKESIAGRK